MTQCCREHLRAWVLRLCCSCFRCARYRSDDLRICRGHPLCDDLVRSPRRWRSGSSSARDLCSFRYRSGNRHGGDHGLSCDRFLAAFPDRRCGHPTEQAALRTREEHEERIVGRKERADKTCFLRTAAEQLDCSSYSIKFVDSTVRTYHCMNFSRGFLRAYPRSAAGTKKSASSPIAIQKSFW